MGANVRVAPREIVFPRGDFPPDFPLEVVERYDEATDILRSDKFRPAVEDNTVPVQLEPDGAVRIAEEGCPVHHGGGVEAAALRGEAVRWADLFRYGALLRSEGEDHVRRRRALSPLFTRNAHLWFRDTAIYPNLERNLSHVMADADDDGVARIDLIPFLKSIFVQMAASLVGFDGVDTPEGAAHLIQLEAAIGERLKANSMPFGPELEDVMRDSFAAHKEVYNRYALPSMQRRLELVRVSRQDGTEDQLPRDLLTLAARGEIEFEESDGAIQVAIQLLSNLIGTNVNAITYAMSDLFAHLRLHPEDRQNAADPDFLFSALRESLRLHSVGAAGLIVREALEDVTLPTGRFIAAGSRIALVHDAVNRDATVFGADADEFNPRRDVARGVRPYGLAFGNGQHICIGLPLVLGQGNITGIHVPILKALYDLDVRPDENNPAVRSPDAIRDNYIEFPVVLTAR